MAPLWLTLARVRFACISVFLVGSNIRAKTMPRNLPLQVCLVMGVVAALTTPDDAIVDLAYSASNMPHGISGAAVNDVTAEPSDRHLRGSAAIVYLGNGDLLTSFSDARSRVIGAGHRTGYSYSSDFGITWIDGGKLPESAAGDI